MEAFVGKWNLETSDNFDEYMKAAGVSFMTRKVASTAKPSYVITVEGDGTINLRTESALKNHDMKFKLGVPFDETTSDGRKCKSTITLDGKKLTQDQKGDVDSIITRELTDSNTLVVVCTAAGVTSTRTYKKVT